MAQNKKPVSFDEWAAAGGGVKPAETGLIGRAGDLGISVLKGAIAVPEAAVGLADIATGGKAGKAAEGIGFRPKEAKEFLDSKKSDAAKDAAWRFENAEGFTGKLGAAVQNPSLIANAIAESAPLMGAGGVIGRGVAALTPRVAGAAGAIGEGAVGAGSAAEQIRQQTADGELTGSQAGLAGLAGVATAGLGMLGKKAANAMGVGDIDTALVSGTTKVAGQAGKETPGMLKRVGGGALAEGVFEELPQSVAEQGLQNIALDKPFTQDLDAAAAMGLVTGGAMGAGMGIMSSPADAKGPGPGAAPDAPPMATPAPTVAGPNFGAPGKTVLDERSLYAAGVTPPPMLDTDRLDGMLGEPQKPVDTFASILDTDGVYERWSNVRDGTDRQAMRDQMEYVSQTYGGKVGPDNRYEVDAELARQFKWYRAAPMEMRSAALNRLAEQPARGPSDADLISQEQAGGVRRTYDPRSGVAPDVPLGLVPEVDGVPFDEPAKPFRQNFVIPERPSVAMGLDPSLGGLTSAAALAVDTGASPAVSQGFGMRRMGEPVDVQPISSAAGLIGTPRRIGESPIIDVEAREVLDRRAIQTASPLPFDQGGVETTATGQPLSLPAPTNLREGLSRIRAQREQVARMAQQVQQPTQGALNGPQADQTQQTETQRPQAQPSAVVAADSPASAGPVETAVGGGIEQSRLPNDGAIANNVVEEKTIAANSIAQKAKVRKSQKTDAAEQVWQTKTLSEREKLVGDAGVNGIFALRMAEKQWGKVPEKVRKKLAVALAPEEDAIAAPSTPGTWEKFGEDTGTLNVPRAEMPQIKTAHRGAMTNFLNARGVGHEAVEVDPATLKPTQAEFSPEKVERAKEAGGDRSILISSDDHIIDGHHQAVAKLETGEPVKAIRLDAPAAELLPLVKEFPSATVDASSGPVEAEKPATAPDDDSGLPDGWKELRNGFNNRPVYRMDQGGGKPFAVVQRNGINDFSIEIRLGDKRISQVDAVKPKADALALAKSKLDEASGASTHKDPGEKPEAATPAVVQDSLKKAAKNEDVKPSDMKKWLLGEIDKAMAQAPGYAEYKDVVASNGEKFANDLWMSGEDDSTGMVTFDVPGDGTFKVRNSVRGLLEFRKKVEQSKGFSDAVGRRARPDEVDSVRNGSGGRLAAVANMIDEGDFEAARDYAEAVGINLADVNVPKGERKPQWDAFLRDGTLPPPPDTKPRPAPKTAAQLDEEKRQAAEAEAKKPKDTGWNMAGIGYGGKRYIGRNIITDDGREIVARVYENAGNYEEAEVKVDGARKFAVNDRYNAQDKADAFIRTLAGKTAEATKDAKPAKVTPQVSGNPDKFIKVAADSVTQLRAMDVDRVLTETPVQFRAEVAMHIKSKRADLAGEVDDVMADLRGGNAAPAASAQPAAEPATATQRRDPTKVSMFNPYEDGDTVAIDGQDWTVKQDTPGWYLTNTGNWRGTHPTIRNIKAMADLIRAVEQAAVAQPATPPATTKLTQVEAADLMEWVALGTKDGVTKHILTFYESKADKEANRGRMTVATVTKGDRSPDHWMVDGDDTRFGIRLAAAKKRGMEIGMAKAKSDGFVVDSEAAAAPVAASIDWDAMPADVRTNILTSAGWRTNAGGLNLVGKRLLNSKWADIVAGTRATIERFAGEVAAKPEPKKADAPEAIQDSDQKTGGAMFSRSKPSDEEQRALDALSANDELFALPRPTADNIEGIAAEIDPEIKVEKAKAEPGIKEKYKLTMPGGEVGYLYVRAPNPYGPTVYAFDLANGQMTNKVEERPGDNPEDVDPDIEDVYIDVSKLTEGGGGNEVYAIAGAFAHSTGRMFIGDPAGLSDEAMRRRPEAMLSLALKYGTTDFMAPHPRQMRGDAQLKIPGLKWVYGDSVGNIKRLVELNVKALDNAFPDAAKVLFDERTGSFVNADSGKVIGLQFLGARMDRLRSGGASEARKALAGRKTVARGAVWRSLLRQPRETTGGVDGGRNGLLAGLARIAAQSNPATKGLFSRDQSKPTGIAPTLAQQVVDGITARWANAPDVVVLADMQDEKAPMAVRDYDAQQRSQGAEGEPEGFWYKGKAYIVASALSNPADVARVLFHEALGHYGLRGTFGKGLSDILNQISVFRKADVRAKAEQYGLDFEDPGQRLQAAEEVLAEMAETNPQIGFVKRAIAVIRAWLRKHVPGFGKMALTDEEIVSQYLLPARDFVVNGGPNGGPGGGVKFQTVDTGLGQQYTGTDASTQPTADDQNRVSKLGAAVAKFLNTSEPASGSAYRAVSLPDAADIQSIGAAFGKRVVGFGLNPVLVGKKSPFSTAGGVSLPSMPDAVFININGNRPHISVLGHELAHTMRRDNPALYDELVGAIRPYIKQTEYGLGFSKERVARDLKNPDAIREEFIGEVISDGFTEPTFWNAIGEKSPALLSRVVGAVGSLIDKVRRVFGPQQRTKKYLTDFDRVMEIAGEAMARYKVDALDDTPVFSRSVGRALTDGVNNVRELKLPAGYIVNDFMKSNGRLGWWHKTVGTQYDLAQRNPLFKRVFDTAQGFLNDVSYYASEAANKAPTLLPKLETLKDLGKQAVSAADNKAIAAPIFEGTLVWGRSDDGRAVRLADENDDTLEAGVVFTPDELRLHFDLSDKQIALYQEFRAATDKSLTNMGLADMVRFGGKDLEGVADEVLAAENFGQALAIAGAQLRAVARGEPKRAAVLLDSIARMAEKVNKYQGLIDKGYAPLSRFGRYTLDVVDAGGQRVYFGLFESEAEANKMARQMRANYPGAQVAQGTVSEEEHKLFAGVSPETVELFGEMLGLEGAGDEASDLAFQQYLKMAKANRSAMKRLIHRKGIAGFSEDPGRVLAGFVYSNARQTSSAVNMGELTQAVAAIPKGQGDLKDHAVRLHNYVKNPIEEAQAFRGLLFAQYIGGSVASAVINTTQPFAVTMPWLSQFGGVSKAAKQMSAAARDALKGATGDDALDQALKKAEEDGIVSPQEVFQLQAQAAGRATLRAGDGTKAGDAMATASNALSKLGIAWGQLFGLAEQFNRRTTFIAAYRTAVDQGMADPAAFSERAINETQFIYSKANKPRWARGAVGSTLFTFKQYSVSYVELMARMATSGPEGRKAALLGLAILFLLSGAGGLPFAEDVDDLVDGIMQRLGYNLSSKQAKQEFFAGILGEDGAKFMMRGISGVAGVPVDVSGRFGMGNLIPSTGLLTTKTDYTRDVVEIFGPAGDLVPRMFKAGEKLVQGEVLGARGALATASPIAGQNLVKAMEMANTGMYLDKKGRKVLDVDGYDAAMKAIGFQPNQIAEVQDASFDQQRMIGVNRMREAEISDKWARGLFLKDKEMVSEARESLAEWNANNPDTPIQIKMPQILRRLREMNLSKTERVAKAAPQEVRARVREELGVP